MNRLLSETDVRVFYSFVPHPEKATWHEGIRAILSSEEYAEATHRVRAADQHSCLSAYLLRRVALSACAGLSPSAWQFRRTKSGKPFISTPRGYGMELSISHTEGLVACVIATQRCGIDVEKVRELPYLGNLATLVCSQRELERGVSGLDLRQFFRIWSVKEAYAKASDQAAAFRPRGIEVNLGKPGNEAWQPSVKGWHFALKDDVAGYSFAVAVELLSTDTPSISYHETALAFSFKPAV